MAQFQILNLVAPNRLPRILGILGWLVLWIFMLPVVRGSYNCSKSLIPEDDVPDFRENLKQACANLKSYLFVEPGMHMNLSATSEKTGLSVWVWGNCNTTAGSDACHSCINDLADNMQSVCNNSSWGELAITNEGKILCFVHYDGVEYISDAPTTLIKKFWHSLLFFLSWHLFMFVYMCLK